TSEALARTRGPGRNITSANGSPTIPIRWRTARHIATVCADEDGRESRMVGASRISRGLDRGAIRCTTPRHTDVIYRWPGASGPPTLWLVQVTFSKKVERRVSTWEALR